MERNADGVKKRAVLVLFANMILAMGVSLLRLSGFGTDPFSCMNLGISSHLPVSFGTWQMLFNVALFIPVYFLDRGSFGLGALINMFLLGYFVDLYVFLYGLFGITIEGMAGYFAARVFLLFLGVLVICFGVALYMACDMGAAPYDRLSVIVERYTGGRIKFKWARIFADLICMFTGYAAGSVVGAGTVIVAFFTGPLVSFCREKAVLGIMAHLGLNHS